MMRICRKFTAQASGEPVYLDADRICAIEGDGEGSRITLADPPLQFAVREGPEEIVRRLAELDAEVNGQPLTGGRAE